MDLEWLAREISHATSKHVLPSGDRGIFILKLGRKIQSVSQLTSQQLASMTDHQRFQILSFMANNPNPLEGHLDHHHGRHHPTEGESSSGLPTAHPLEVDQEASSEAQNTLVGTSRPTEPSRCSHTKVRTYRGHARGRHTKEESGDAV